MSSVDDVTGRSSAESLHAQLDRFATDVGELYRRQKERSEELEQALSSLRTAYRETVRSMAFVVEAKDAYTGQHLERCRVYGLQLLQSIGAAWPSWALKNLSYGYATGR